MVDAAERQRRAASSTVQEAERHVTGHAVPPHQPAAAQPAAAGAGVAGDNFAAGARHNKFAGHDGAAASPLPPGPAAAGRAPEAEALRIADLQRDERRKV